MTWNFNTSEWIGIGSIAIGAIGSIASAVMAVATFHTLRNNKDQFKELQKQNFESTLFQLLHETKKILSEVSLPILEKEYTDIKYPIYQEEKDFNMKGHPIAANPTFENIQEKYNYIYKHTSNLGSYFRSLYRVIKYIDESKFTDKEKYQYTSFVRAQLTDIELLWLFYNCTMGYGKEKFKPLIEKWTLLKNIPKDRLIDAKHIEWIDDSAINRKKESKHI